MQEVRSANPSLTLNYKFSLGCMRRSLFSPASSVYSDMFEWCPVESSWVAGTVVFMLVYSMEQFLVGKHVLGDANQYRT
jgi:hypothetical protein